MALTIKTPITGIGGNPPTHIRVEGTVSGCEILHVLTSCNTNAILVPIPTGGQNQWSIDVPNDNNCGCGTLVKVNAFCGLGAPGDQIVITTLPLICDTCPTAAVTRISESNTCDVNGKRTVTLEATVTSPANSVAVGQWDFGYAPTGGSSAGPQIGVKRSLRYRIHP